jgi:tetratricopeptide (TPR) repeat protein
MNFKRRRSEGQENHETLRVLQAAFGDDIPTDAERRLQKPLDGFRSDLAVHPYVQRLSRASRRAAPPWLRRLALAASTGVVAVALGLLLFLGKGTPAWAEVVERFQSVPFFSVAVYIKEDSLSEARQFELWMAQGARVRMRVGNEVIFAHEGKVTKAFDVKSRGEVEPDDTATEILEMLGKTGQFSLETIVRSVSGGKLVDATPRVNAEAVISEDLVVFDLESARTPEWARIWALRESRLPVRVLMWDPRDGACADAVFSYARQQSDAFFDPEAFATELKSGAESRGKANLAYALLRDPGGRPITPRDMFERAPGYHVPVVEEAGITEDGVVWIVAAQSQNTTPAGYVFYGFEKLEDDLAREYRSTGAWGAADDRSLHIFLPSDYPFDNRTPQRLILTCQTKEYDPRVAPQVIGTVELTDWQRNKKWPEALMSHDFYPLVLAARYFLEREDYDSFEKAMALIPGDPESDPQALEREQLRLRMLLKKQDFDAAVKLGGRLMPLLEHEYTRWKGGSSSPQLFNDYLVALAADGQIEKARELYQRILNLEPDIPDHLNQHARSNIKRSNAEFRQSNMRLLADGLSQEARLTVDQLSDFFGVDVKNDKRFDHFEGRDWKWFYKKPVYAAWIKHLDELAGYYQDHPLPETMELRPRKIQAEFFACTRDIPGIDTHEVASLSRSLSAYVYEWDGSPGNLVEMPKELQQIQLDHDLVYRKGVSLAEQQAFVLGQFGYDVDVVTEPRKVWVARYDGRALKPYEQVRAPVRYTPGGDEVGMSMVPPGGRFTMGCLLRDLMRYQTEVLPRLIVIDETGIPSEGEVGKPAVPVSCEQPLWSRTGGIEMARKWFAEQFGVTFTEETRLIPVHVVRKRT